MGVEAKSALSEFMKPHLLVFTSHSQIRSAMRHYKIDPEVDNLFDHVLEISFDNNGLSTTLYLLKVQRLDHVYLGLNVPILWVNKCVAILHLEADGWKFAKLNTDIMHSVDNALLALCLGEASLKCTEYAGRLGVRLLGKSRVNTQT